MLTVRRLHHIFGDRFFVTKTVAYSTGWRETGKVYAIVTGACHLIELDPLRKGLQFRQESAYDHLCFLEIPDLFRVRQLLGEQA